MKANVPCVYRANLFFSQCYPNYLTHIKKEKYITKVRNKIKGRNKVKKKKKKKIEMK